MSQVASAKSITPKCCRLHCRGIKCLFYLILLQMLTWKHMLQQTNFSPIFGADCLEPSLARKGLITHCGQIKYWWSRGASLVKESPEIHYGGGGGCRHLSRRIRVTRAGFWSQVSQASSQPQIGQWVPSPECDLTPNQDRHLLHYSLPFQRISEMVL